MLVDVVMPKMGESIQEGKILRWMKKVGEKIARDETILEISTDKVDSEIPSPVAGILASIVVAEQETVPVGTVIARVETDAATPVPVATTPPVAASTATTGVPGPTAAPIEVLGALAPMRIDGNRFYSPLVRSIAKQEGLTADDLGRIAGTGVGGRVTKQDVLAFLKSRPAAGLPAGVRSAAQAGGTAVAGARYEPAIQRMDLAELQNKYPAPRHEILQMDNIQQRMAEHMLRSVATSPHVQAIDEVDVTAIVNYRTREASDFEKREGFKLTFTPFFFHVVTKALEAFPLVNASVEGDKIILKKYINIGMAVASPTGLIVPVLKNCEDKSFLGLARAINDIAVRTRNKKLQPDEILGGTFTITNYGIFGNIIGIPIINQPQVAILGTGAIKKRPVIVTDADGTDLIGIRSMVYLTLSFDHRIIDGAIGGQFLANVKEGIERFDFGEVK